MKICENFMLQKVANNYVVVPVEEKSITFKAMITLNETGAFLWKKLTCEKTKEQLIEDLTLEYEVDRATAEKDINSFISVLEEHKIIV